MHFFAEFRIGKRIRKKTDVVAIVRRMSPQLEILEPKTFGKRIPVRCHVCVANRPVVFDLIDGFTPQALRQHLESARHVGGLATFNQRNVQIDQIAQSADDADGDLGGADGLAQNRPSRRDSSGSDQSKSKSSNSGPASSQECESPCLAWSLNDAPKSDKLAQVAESLKMYTGLCARQAISNLNQIEKMLDEEDGGLLHDYQVDLNTGNVTIRHRNCTRKASMIDPGMGSVCRAVCKKCRDLGKDRYILRVLAKFVLKHYAAQLLRARFFFPEQVETIIEDIKQNDIYRQGITKDLDSVITMQVSQLQRFVRSSFLCIPQTRQPENLKFYIGTVVKPCMEINPNDWNAEIAAHSQTLAKKISSKGLCSVQDVELKMACKIANGSLRNHSVLQGLLCALIERAERQDRGVHTMRRLTLSETEMDMISEAGVSLSMAAGNKSLLKMFGLAFKSPKATLLGLHSMSLPEPFLANLSSEILSQNGLLIDAAYVRHQAAPRRRLTMAFDKTYLLKSIDIAQIRMGKCWIGSAFEAFAENDQQGTQGYIKLLEDDRDDSANLVMDASKVQRADELCEFLVWDPASTLKGRPRFPLCSVPMRYECSSLEMLHLVGTVLEHGGDYIRCIVSCQKLVFFDVLIFLGFGDGKHMMK